jgi:plastocyanin
MKSPIHLVRAALLVAALAVPAAAQADSGGAIRGVVALAGDAPERKPVSMSADPMCARGDPQTSEAVVATDGTLRDVHVRIRAGTVAGRHEAPSSRVQIDQVGCMYRPRVVGIMEGQKLAIGNSDMTLHNVHAYAEGKSRFNLGQPPKGPAIEREPGAAGQVLELRCDIHAWMRAYAVVSDHPFFDVTADDGRFAIDGVPPGTYTLEAWHPELGLERATIRVRAGETVRQRFSFEVD